MKSGAERLLTDRLLEIRGGEQSSRRASNGKYTMKSPQKVKGSAGLGVTVGYPINEWESNCLSLP